MIERSRSILGIDVAVMKRSDVVNHLDVAIETGAPVKLAFLNANLANIAYTTPALRQALAGFLVLNDGLGLDLASRALHGRAFDDNLNGTDFIPFLLSESRHSLRIFLFGGRPDVNRDAAARIAERWPRHEVVGAVHGYVSASEVDAVADQAARARADLVLVALGNPAQELWIARHVPPLNGCVAGVGALFDFLTGTVARAPRWVRALRCEWIYRLALEPSRLWKRYLVGNPLFLLRVAGELVRRRLPS